ncbi:hypothetical protein LSH36_496g02075 [Paralvinella palmiformis]|uniref:ELMO domain-containing protein n=1 Tax=Paralvinella palmiformis TaxID=53620 RepID=A0AAD9J8K9_9ANNE|nr:hypothetical protein LSH36_496g02075 [Paralvinella palmiformis]
MVDGIAIMVLRSRLSRICGSRKMSEGQKTRKIENILRKTKLPILSRLYADDPDGMDDAMDVILGTDTCTLCVQRCQPGFELQLRGHLEEIRGYNQLIKTVESLRRIPYNTNNIQHEEMLLQLWQLLCPHKKLRAPVTKQWTELGFQGKNPRTDFRGMGLLGLHNLLFFASEYPDKARELLSHSKNEKYGYSFAIVGINMTSLAYNLLCRGSLKSYIYNSIRGPARIYDFHNFYCYLLCEFDKFWMMEKPTNLMQFTSIKSKFEKRISSLLNGKNISINPVFIKTDCQNRHLQLHKAKQTTSLIDEKTGENDILNTSYYLWV